MADKVLTLRGLTEHEHRALKLHAVLQGRSVNGMVLELIRAELAKSAPTAPGRGREEFVADLYARLGIDPDSPEHQAAAARAEDDIRRTGDGAAAAGAA